MELSTGVPKPSMAPHLQQPLRPWHTRSCFSEVQAEKKDEEEDGLAEEVDEERDQEGAYEVQQGYPWHLADRYHQAKRRKFDHSLPSKSRWHPDEDLVTAVFEMQDTKEGLERWRKFCDLHGDAVYNPKHHCDNFLKRFLRQHQDIEQMFDSPPEELILRVKAVQRAAREGKDFWDNYCREHGHGELNPSMHDAYFLEAFMSEAMDANMLHARPPAPEDLVERVIVGQKQSIEFHRAWEQFCDEKCDGKRDPRLQDAAILSVFLNTVASKIPAESERPSQKLLDEAFEYRGRHRDLWNRFCDEHGGGTRDPRKHDRNFLSRFLRAASNAENDNCRYRDGHSGYQRRR